MYQQPQANTSNYTNYSPYNFYLSPNISRKNTQEISTRYSAINPIHQSQFLDEEQVETIITTTSTYNQPNPAKRLHSQSQYISSGSDLIGDIQRANQSICQITNDLKGFNDSIRKRSALMDETRKSTYSFYEGTSITPVSNNNLNADYTFPSPNPRTARSYTNFNQEIPMSVSQNLNAPLRSSQYINTMNKSALNFKESTIREPNPLSLSTFHDGTQTVINFPFCTYNKHEESEVNDTRANYRSTYQSQLPSFQSQLPTQQSKQAEEEDSSRRYYVKHEDLEYEEFEDFTNPENNYKRIKYPYQANWQRVHQIPEFIQSVIDAQKNRSSEPTAQIEQSSPLAFVPQQQQYQQQQAVKQPNYVPKASINLLDDTNCRSYVETNNTLSGSYLNSANNIPFQYY